MGYYWCVIGCFFYVGFGDGDFFFFIEDKKFVVGVVVENIVVCGELVLYLLVQCWQVKCFFGGKGSDNGGEYVVNSFFYLIFFCQVCFGYSVWQMVVIFLWLMLYGVLFIRCLMFCVVVLRVEIFF